jgi:hypothetical protein
MLVHFSGDLLFKTVIVAEKAKLWIGNLHEEKGFVLLSVYPAGRNKDNKQSGNNLYFILDFHDKSG